MVSGLGTCVVLGFRTYRVLGFGSYGAFGFGTYTIAKEKNTLSKHQSLLLRFRAVLVPRAGDSGSVWGVYRAIKSKTV